MAGPTQSKVYPGTPEHQHEAYLLDAAQAVQFGWEPISFEQVRGSLRVVYEQREADSPILPAVGQEPPVPASGLLAAAKDGRRDLWEPVVIGAFLGAIILAIWGLFVYKPEPPGAGGGPTTVRRAVARCSPASAALIDTVEAGLTVQGGGGLRDGFTVASPDHVGSLFVAARINGIGIDGAVGLWAIDDLGGQGAIFSVNSKARAFSIWPDGGAMEGHLTELDDGAEVAVACADG